MIFYSLYNVFDLKFSKIMLVNTPLATKGLVQLAVWRKRRQKKNLYVACSCGSFLKLIHKKMLTLHSSIVNG
jgi:hypothetical protein